MRNRVLLSWILNSCSGVQIRNENRFQRSRTVLFLPYEIAFYLSVFINVCCHRMQTPDRQESQKRGKARPVSAHLPAMLRWAGERQRSARLRFLCGKITYFNRSSPDFLAKSNRVSEK